MLTFPVAHFSSAAGGTALSTTMAVAHFTSPYLTIYNTSDWSKVSNPSTLPPNAGWGVAFN